MFCIDILKKKIKLTPFFNTAQLQIKNRILPKQHGGAMGQWSRNRFDALMPFDKALIFKTRSLG